MIDSLNLVQKDVESFKFITGITYDSILDETPSDKYKAVKEAVLKTFQNMANNLFKLIDADHIKDEKKRKLVIESFRCCLFNGKKLPELYTESGINNEIFFKYFSWRQMTSGKIDQYFFKLSVLFFEWNEREISAFFCAWWIFLNGIYGADQLRKDFTNLKGYGSESEDSQDELYTKNFISEENFKSEIMKNNNFSSVQKLLDAIGFEDAETYFLEYNLQTDGIKALVDQTVLLPLKNLKSQQMQTVIQQCVLAILLEKSGLRKPIDPESFKQISSETAIWKMFNEPLHFEYSLSPSNLKDTNYTFRNVIVAFFNCHHQNPMTIKVIEHLLTFCHLFIGVENFGCGDFKDLIDQ